MWLTSRVSDHSLISSLLTKAWPGPREKRRRRRAREREREKCRKREREIEVGWGGGLRMRDRGADARHGERSRWGLMNPEREELKPAEVAKTASHNYRRAFGFIVN